jgi:hypothetical protein
MIYPVYDKVEFDAETHTYHVDGLQVPSVTRIVGLWRDSISGNSFQPDPWYAKRGTIVHKCIAMATLGTLKRSSVATEAEGFFAAWQAWSKGKRFKSSQVEKVVVGHGYAGTLDLIHAGVLYDYKTGKPHWTHELQLAAYRRCLPRLKKNVCVYLSEDGTFKEREWNYKVGWRWFRAAMELWKCKEAHTRKVAKEANGQG